MEKNFDMVKILRDISYLKMMQKLQSKDHAIVNESYFAKHIREQAENVIDLDKIGEDALMGDIPSIKAKRRRNQRAPRRQMLLRKLTMKNI